MSAKKVSKMCNFVHKSVKNARFSPRKCTFCALFAGGRGDFLAGQKRGFLGSSRVPRGTRRDARKFHFLVSLNASLIEFVTLMIAANKKSRTYFFICIIRLSMNWSGRGVLRTHRAQMDIMSSYRHSELAERTESVKFILIFFNTNIILFPLQSRAACTPVHEA